MPSRRSSRRVFHQDRIRLPGVVSFGRYQYAASRSGLPPHSHKDAMEICFLERGEQTYRVGGLLHRLRGNDQFFTLPGEVHDTANLPEERGILYWLIIRLDPSQNLLGLAGPFAERLKSELRGMPTRHFRAHPDCGPILAGIHDALRAARRRTFPSPGLQVQSLLLQYLTLTIWASHLGAHGTASPLIQRVLAHIGQHVRDPIQVALLAQVARLSESRLKARFRREIGVPPAEFWLRQKIDLAIVLLRSRPVTDVAYELGFSSSQYFATAFKRYTLVNPSQFHADAARRSPPAQERLDLGAARRGRLRAPLRHRKRGGGVGEADRP